MLDVIKGLWSFFIDFVVEKYDPTKAEFIRAKKVARAIYKNETWRTDFRNTILQSRDLLEVSIPDLEEYIFLQEMVIEGYIGEEHEYGRVTTTFGYDVIKQFLTIIADE